MVDDMRDKRICVNKNEKNRIEDIRNDIFGTSSAPLGEALKEVMDYYEDN